MAPRTVLFFTLLLVPGAAVYGQRAGAPMAGSMSFNPSPSGGTPVINAPFRDDEFSEQRQMLADGTQIYHKFLLRHVVRDGQGRVRTDRPMVMADDAPMVVEIDDVVAGVQYTLDLQKKVAHRYVVPGGVAVAARAASTATGPVSGKVEDLGSQVMAGVAAEGRRSNLTVPADAEGNDRPMTVTSESWVSQELKITLYTKVTDPRSGDTIFRVENLNRQEPDPELFRVPPGFTVVAETGPFTITYRR